jgi:hypothetical protein
VGYEDITIYSTPEMESRKVKWLSGARKPPQTADKVFGHRYARLRRIGKVFEQCLLCAAVQNMKKVENPA